MDPMPANGKTTYVARPKFARAVAVLLIAILTGTSAHAAPATPVPSPAVRSASTNAVKTVTASPTAVPGGPATQAVATKVAPKVPNPKTDPKGALVCASQPGRLKSAAFTYQMEITMKPADDASAKALGPAVDQLSQASQKMTGEGAFEITDVKKNLANSRMTMAVTARGQTTEAEIVVRGNNSWVCATGAECLKLSTTLDTGVDPAKLLKLLEKASKVTWVDSKPLKAEAVHHLRYTLDKKSMDALIPAATRTLWQQVFGSVEMTGTIDVWITAKELQVRQLAEIISVAMAFPDAPDAKVRADVAMTMRYDKINQPVNIVAPK